MLNGLRRWVDPRVPKVRIAELTAYLRDRGWTERPAPRPQQLAFDKPAGSDEGFVYLPASEQSADYPQRVLEVITELAEIEDRYALDVLNDILTSQRPTGPNGASKDLAVPPGAVSNL